MPETKPLFTDPILSLKAATCQRGGKTLFQNLSLEVRSGDLLHLAGSNGVGKTSLLRVMAGALPLSDGYVIFNASGVAFLPAHDQSLKVLETAEENLIFWTGKSKTVPDILIALEKMKIAHLRDKSVRYFSAGQKRRLSLSRIFLSDAPVWLLDEPFNGLDAESVDLAMVAISAHRAEGGIVVIAGHHEVQGARVIRMGGDA